MTDETVLGEEARQDDRETVTWSATLILEDDTVYDCHVIDVAFAGTQIETDAPVELEDEVILRIDTLGDFAATVKWAKGEAKGLYLMGGPDLLLKKFSETSGENVSTEPLEDKDPGP